MADMDETSIRVALRVRPFLTREILEGCEQVTTVVDGFPQITIQSHSFTYDYVWDQTSSQEDVFEVVKGLGLIEGCYEGYNATIIAYGQTGSGKTFTQGTGFDVEALEGNIATSAGLIPRCVHALFEHFGEENVKVHINFIELYNEEIRDLLARGANKGIRIHEDSNGSIFLQGVSSVPVTCVAGALRCLRDGALNRTTAATNMNDQSSRSHAVFTLVIKHTRGLGEDRETFHAKFHFVDLAGSERLKRTGAVGERQKEGISINSGLLCLGNVISALGDCTKKALHVPYRDSKLTRLLQDALGGNSRTFFIACISPSDRDFVETLNTLKYANRARNIKNKVVVNQDKASRTIALLKQEIAELREEVFELKQGRRTSDGISDAAAENTMLHNELHAIKQKLKHTTTQADKLAAANAQLRLERDTQGFTDIPQDVHALLLKYSTELEELRAKASERDEPPSPRSPRSPYNGHENVEDLDEDQMNQIEDEIISKELLIQRLETSNKRMEEMRRAYEKKISDLSAQINKANGERDAVVANLKKNPQDKNQEKLKAEFEQRICNLEKEKKNFEDMQKKHSKLIRANTDNEAKIRMLKVELEDMKRMKVKLMNRAREENAKARELDSQRVREISSLKKHNRIKDMKVRDLESASRVKEIVLKRKHEEINALKKLQKAKMSQKARGRVIDTRGLERKWEETRRLLRQCATARDEIDRVSNEIENLDRQRRKIKEDIKAHDPSDVEHVTNLQEALKYVEEKMDEVRNKYAELEEPEFDAIGLEESEAAFVCTQLFAESVTSLAQLTATNEILERIKIVKDQQEREIRDLRTVVNHYVSDSNVAERMRAPPPQAFQPKARRLTATTAELLGDRRALIERNSPPVADQPKNVFDRLRNNVVSAAAGSNSGSIKRLRRRDESTRVIFSLGHSQFGHAKGLLALDVAGNKIHSGGNDGLVKTWDLERNIEVHNMALGPPVHAVKWDACGNVLLAASGNQVKLVDLRLNKVVAAFPSNGDVKGSFGSVDSQVKTFALTGSKIFLPSGDCVRTFDLRNMSNHGLLPGRHGAQIMTILFSHNPKRLITGSKDHSIRVWDLSENTIAWPTTLEPPHYDGVECLAVRGNTLISGSRDSCLKRWDLGRNEMRQSLVNVHPSWVIGASFVEGSVLVTASKDGIIKVWNEDMKEVASVANKEGLSCLVSDENRVYTGGNNGQLGLWKVNTFNASQSSQLQMTQSTGAILNSAF